MIRFAVIGTNWITRQFVEAAHESGKYKLTAVYSRSLEQAQHFANDFSVEHLFTSLEAMAESDAIDAVYIASPNSLHFSQTQLFLSHKIHVICEKPLASSICLRRWKRWQKAMPLTRCILPAQIPCTFPRHNFSLVTKFM